MGTVVLTASEGSFPGLAQALRERGVEVLELPLVQFLPPADWAPLDEALAQAKTYQSLALTSPRAAKSVVERIRVRRLSWPVSPRPVVWAVGGATADALEDLLGVVRVPQSQTRRAGAAEELAAAMLEAGTRGPVLFPCGEKRREELSAILRRHGVRVDEIVCYRAALADESMARAAGGSGTLLVVASPSVVELLVRAQVSGPDLVAVGPTTAASARAAGWPPAAVADEPTTSGVAAAISGLLARR